MTIIGLLHSRIRYHAAEAENYVRKAGALEESTTKNIHEDFQRSFPYLYAVRSDGRWNRPYKDDWNRPYNLGATKQLTAHKIDTVNSFLSPLGGLLISSTVKGVYWRRGVIREGAKRMLKYENFFALNTNGLLFVQKAHIHLQYVNIWILIFDMLKTVVY